MSGRRGLVWDGETVAVGDGVVKSKKIKQDLRKHKSTTAYESIFNSNKSQSVYLRGKSAPIAR